MVGNIGIGIANAIGFKHRRIKGGGGSGNISYPGLIAAWSAKGKSNDDEDRAVLRDLTGNGHDITLNGFAFSEMSGYGGYGINYNNLKLFNSNNNDYRADVELIKNKLIVTKIYKTTSFAELRGSNKVPSYKIKVSGIKGFVLKYRTEINTENVPYFEITEDGTYTLPAATISTAYQSSFSINTIGECNVIIELLPEYPDALVFDGVDDWGKSNDKIKALKEYTVILKRKIISNRQYSCVLYKGINEVSSKTYNMLIEYYEEPNWFYKVGIPNIIIPYDKDIIYVTEKSYNGKSINYNLEQAIDTPVTLGGIIPGFVANMAFYSAYLFDRSLDEQEIKSFIRKYIDAEYLLPSEIPTPDCYYDFSQGSNDDETRDTIKDLSGNGNDAVAHNFAWNKESSGYKDGALYFDGVDDYISLDAFDSGFKTVFMVCENHTIQKLLYDQRNTQNVQRFAIYTGDDSVGGSGKSAYYGRADDSCYTYINGILNNNRDNNNLLPSILRNKKHLITILSNDVVEVDFCKINIGANSSANAAFADMALYKFLGFKEALTEEQINAIIKKYNLLDGVDKIEVS